MNIREKLWLICPLVVFAAGLYLLLLQLPETGGDARSNWIAAHRLLFGEHQRLSLSLSRLGIQIPTSLAILLFGSHSLTYHIAPILMGVFSSVLIYFLVSKYSGALVGSIASLCFMSLNKIEQGWQYSSCTC